MDEKNTSITDVAHTSKEPILHLSIFGAGSKFKSIGRAIRRGHVTSWGEEIPKRPFNNRKRTPGRELQVAKERIYGELKHRKQVH